MHSLVSAPDPLSKPPLIELLHRPPSERLREFKYRFAQATVFGLPAVALQIWGRTLGGFEADRWVAVLQALLVGWVVYIGAAGMLFEGLLLLPRRRFSVDLLPALIAVSLYLLGFVQLIAVLVGTRRPLLPAFALSSLLLIGWCGLRWAWLTWRARHAHDARPADLMGKASEPKVESR